MNVSLDQAVKMHAVALKRRHGRQAPIIAGAKADYCARLGDADGRQVWSRVAAIAEKLLAAELQSEEPSTALA